MQKYKINIQNNKDSLLGAINEIASAQPVTNEAIYRIFKKYPVDGGNMLSKSGLLLAYKTLKKEGKVALSLSQEQLLLNGLRMKKTRTISGVAPVTVLTKPFPCPGKCIFCPSDVRMPKSYLSNEPGAQRAKLNKFDPYFQTYNRLVAFKNTGHSTDKVELLILGGTWSSYPENYQIWFVKRCFDALNEFNKKTGSDMLQPNVATPYAEEVLGKFSETDIDFEYNRAIAKALLPQKDYAKRESAFWNELYEAHKVNETASSRCVGLVVETRPDEITVDEVIKMRKLGATKVQIGIQSLDNEVLAKNRRGHNVQKTREAISLLRQAGFKIHAHWMPNLYGSTPQRDIKDFEVLFDDKSIRPDELKIYPCSLIKSAELMRYYEKGLWTPYSHENLLRVLVSSLPKVPRYCRVTRVVRDIPSTDIVAGNKKTNFRQIAERELREQGVVLHDIRSREVRDAPISAKSLRIKTTVYNSSVSKEYFIEFVTLQDKIAGFLRLSLPTVPNFMPELTNAAIIREVHVYGQSLGIGVEKTGKAQHKGLGTLLIKKAQDVSSRNGFKKLAVISAIGTRKYYEKFSFSGEGLYQVCTLDE